MSLSQQPYVFGTDRKRILIDFKIIQAHPINQGEPELYYNF